MGPESDYLAVVNEGREIHSVENLMVVDGSVVPHALRSINNATTIMIAENIADSLT